MAETDTNAKPEELVERVYVGHKRMRYRDPVTGKRSIVEPNTTIKVTRTAARTHKHLYKDPKVMAAEEAAAKMEAESNSGKEPEAKKEPENKGPGGMAGMAGSGPAA